jgi:hypothetical protein
VVDERNLAKTAPGIDMDSSKSSNLSKVEQPSFSLELPFSSGPSDEELSQLREQINDLREKYLSMKEMAECEEIHSNDLMYKIEKYSKKITVLENEKMNLLSEIESRPSLAEWKMAQQKIFHLEQKVKNALQYRNDQIEIFQWKKHLPTNEQIYMDKKNHELQLWMIESLPDSVMKEIIQALCRELDLQDYADILPSVKKLKSVVLTVPKMEHFIATISAFVSQRNSHLCTLLNQHDVDKYHSVSSVLSALRKWWEIIVRCTELERFYELVLFELFRCEDLLKYPDNYFSGSHEQIEVRWEERYRNEWRRKDFIEIQKRISDLGDSQKNQFQDISMLAQANERVRNRSDVLIFRIINHLEYLFGINRIEDILPTVNSFFIEYEEVKNFVKLLKVEVGKDTNAAVFTEVLRRLK